MSVSNNNNAIANANADVKPHYILKLFVDSDDTKLSDWYKEAMHKHNAVVQMYLDNVADVHFDAGFDLFCPTACIIAGRETGKLNHKVKTAMHFKGLCPPGPQKSRPNELMSALEFIVSTTTTDTSTLHASTSHASTSHASTSTSHASTSTSHPHAVGYYLYPRSSTGTKTPLRLANSVGIIDSGYRGHIIAVFDNWKEENYCIEPYQRMAQLCPPNLTYPMYVKIVESEEELGFTSRGTGGFGSTGQ